MTKTAPRGEMLLWLSDARGQYIPRDFAASFVDRAKSVSGVSDEDWATLDAGPEIDNEWYWDAWTNVWDNAVVTDENGVEYWVHQDGDCWLVPRGMKWSDRDDCFAWPDDEEEDGDTNE